MDQLVQDFNTALDETAGSSSARFEAKLKHNFIEIWTRSGVSRRKAWKRRCKSTSNLVLTDSDKHESYLYDFADESMIHDNRDHHEYPSSPPHQLQLAGQNVSDDSSSSVDNVGLLSRDRWAADFIPINVPVLTVSSKMPENTRNAKS